MYYVIQVVVVLIGAYFLIKGLINLVKGYNIDKILSILIKKELPKIKEDKN